MHKGALPLLIAFLLSATGCTAVGGAPGNRGRPAAPARPAIRQLTPAEAKAVVKKWIDVSNVTRKRHTTAPLDSIDSGTALRIDRVLRTLDRKADWQPDRLQHVRTAVRIPVMTTYPRWFAASALVTEEWTDYYSILMVFTQPGAGAPWRAVNVAEFAKPTEGFSPDDQTQAFAVTEHDPQLGARPGGPRASCQDFRQGRRRPDRRRRQRRLDRQRPGRLG